MPNYQELHILRMWILFFPRHSQLPSTDYHCCQSLVVHVPCVGQCCVEGEERNVRQEQAKPKRQKDVCSSPNKGSEKWFGPQEWMSSPARLGLGRQGSDGNAIWMFLVPVDARSTNQACWPSCLRLAAQSLVHNKSM